MKISLKSQTNSNSVSLGINNEHASEIYKKCLLFAHNDYSLDFNQDQYASNFEELEKQEKIIQKQISKKSFRSVNKYRSRENNFSGNAERLDRQVVFSTCTRVYLKKNINLLFPIQDFLFECNKHVNKSTGSRSREYLEILLCVKKLKMFYGYIPLKQLHRILAQASVMPGYFSKNFFSLIEKRLDVVLYRSGFVKTIVAARQACRHSKILVNSKVCRSPSILLNPGDIISYLPSKKNTTLFLNQEYKIQRLPSQTQNFFYFDEIYNTPSFSTTKMDSHSNILTSRSLALLLLFCGKCVSDSSILNDRIKNFIEIKHSTKKCVESPNDYNFSSPKQIQSNNTSTSVHYRDATGFFSLGFKKDTFNYSSFIQAKKPGTNTFPKKRSLLFENVVSFSKKIESCDPVLALRFQKKLSVLKGATLSSFVNKPTRNRKKQIDSIFNATGTKPKFENNPIHLEISPITNTIIFLYSPQRVYLPFHLDIDILRKSMQK